MSEHSNKVSKVIWNMCNNTVDKDIIICYNPCVLLHIQPTEGGLMFGRKKRRKDFELEFTGDEKVLELARMHTLIIGNSFSVCAACGGNADLYEETHAMKLMDGEGCGTEFRYVTVDPLSRANKQQVIRLRPDLAYRNPVIDFAGRTEVIQRSIVGEMPDFPQPYEKE